MRPDALIPLIGAMVNLALAIFVLAQNRRSPVGRVFCLLGTAFAVWNFGTYRMFVAEGREQAIFWARFLQFGVIWIPVTFFHLALMVAHIPRPRTFLLIGYVLQGLLSLANFGPWVVAGATRVTYAWYTDGGPLFGVVVAMIVAWGWTAIIWLVKHRRSQPLMLRRRLTPLIVALSSIAFLGANDSLPILGYYYYPFLNYQIYPFGSMAVIFYGLIVSYSVLQHQMLNVHVVLSRYSAHLVRMLFFFLIAFSLLLVVAALTHEFTTVAFLGALGALMVSVFIASTVFPKLLGGATEDLERRLLGDRFEYQDQVRSFLQSMAQYLDMSRLQRDLHTLLLRTFRLESYRLILREEVTNSFVLFQAYPEEASRPLPDWRVDSPVFQLFADGKRDYLTSSTEHLRFPASSLERKARQQLQPFTQDFCFPIIYQEEPLGLLLVGKKSSQEPFTATDVRLLTELSRNLSAVINQIRLRMQIEQAHEMDLLGRMSRGMAHDLNNLLTPISTLMQLSQETGILDDELLPVAMRNLESMRAYIREALFFSENLRPHIQEVELDKLVRQAVEVAANSRAKEVKLVTRIASGVAAEADGVLVQRLIANLISNAIDASTPGGEIVVSLERMTRIDEHREWLRVRVADRGEGIAPENLNRIFTPYFTTKNRGDRDRGFGLGLAICRKIATLHGGNLSIESQLKKGTTVQLDLPSRQAGAEAATPTLIAVPTAA